MIRASTRAAAADAVDRVDVRAYRVPTDAPESDGTFIWDATTIIVVQVAAGDVVGLGYTYGPRAIATLSRDELASVVNGEDPLNVAGLWQAMMAALRNAGRPGIGAMAVAAVDCALWDLKARLLSVSMMNLLGPVRQRVPIYGSGGFTSYDEDRLTRQLAGWVEQGIPRVKMKVGREPGEDPHRVAAARRAIGDEVELYVDANGAYSVNESLAMAVRFADQGVTWFEEPRPTDDHEGLRRVRERSPPGMDIAAGEYGYLLGDFAALLDGAAVDCLQADVTRCAGITGFLQVAALCEERHMPLSAHTAPAQHAHLCCALPLLRHLEYFHDHVRIESLFFDGLPPVVDGALQPDPLQPGHGLTFKAADAEPYAI